MALIAARGEAGEIDTVSMVFPLARSLVRSACLLLGLVAPLELLAGTSGAPLRASLPIAEIVKAPAFSMFWPLRVSPDGRSVAYTVVDRKRVPEEIDPVFVAMRRSGVPVLMEAGDIWIADARAGTSRNLTEGNGSNWMSSWSPDGERLAFFSDRSGTAALWLWDRASGSVRQVSSVVVQGRTQPMWTPDGKTIVTAVLTEGISIEQAASALSGVPVAEKAQMSRSGPSAVVYRSAAAARDFGLDIPTDGGFSSVLRPAATDLAAIDIESGSVRRLVREQDFLLCRLSPDGRKVVLLVQRPGIDADSQQRITDLIVVTLSDGATRIVVNNIRTGTNPDVSWSPDSRFIAFPVGGPTTLPKLAVVSASANVPRLFDVGNKADVIGGSTVRTGGAGTVPLWSPDGGQVAMISADKVWCVRIADGSVTGFDIGALPLQLLRRQVSGQYTSPDSGNSVLVVARDGNTQEEGVASLDLRTGKMNRLAWGPVHYGGYWDDHGFDVSEDGSQFTFIREDASHAPDLWHSDAQWRQPRRMTRIGAVFDRFALGQSRLISWRGPDGALLKGALLLPPGHRDGERHPLVVQVYAGSFLSGAVNRFGFGSGNIPAVNQQVLATRGIAVLFPDVPLARGSPMRDIGAGVEAAVRQAIALGYADAKRIGVMGVSYGGYSTLSAIVSNPELYAAAVARAASGNLTSAYGRFDENGGNPGVGWSEEGQGRMDGTLWEQQERYFKNSPLFYLDRVKAPLLIIHGSADRTVPASESAEVFVGLRRLGQPVEYARYRGEDHWEGTWSAANQQDYLERVTRWFERYLQR